MNNKGLLLTVLVVCILVLSPSFSLSQTSRTAAPEATAVKAKPKAPAVRTTSPSSGFCCYNGQVVSATPNQCKQKQGGYFPTRDEALKYCRSSNVFCCINGKVSEISPKQCKKSQGRAYRSASEAKRKCKPEAIYCCLKGKVKKVSSGECSRVKGIAYTTAAEANRKCKPEAVYCCLKGSIKKISVDECKKKQGESYKTEREARKNCGWCCAEKKVFPTTPDSCKKKEGGYFPTRLQADQQCRKQPQCCIDGELVTYSQAECRKRKGMYYFSLGEANKQCLSGTILRQSKENKEKIFVSDQRIAVVGKLSKQGGRWLLQLNRKVARVTFFDGRKKLGKLEDGRTFNLTLLMSKAKGQRVRAEYEDLKGQVFSQILTVPIELVSVGSGISEKTLESLKLSKPPSSQFQPVNLSTIIEVVEPSAGDFLNAGQQYDIVFNVKEDLSTNCAQILLHRNGSQVHVINQQFNIRTTPGQDGYHWNVPSDLGGGYKIVVKTCDDSAGGISDPFLIASYAPDLSVGNLSLTPLVPNSYDSIHFSASVTNIGQSIADGSLAHITVRDPDGGEYEFRLSIPPLGFGSHDYIQKAFKVNKAGTYEISVNVSLALATILETNLDNNESSLFSTIVGVPDLVVCFERYQMATTIYPGGPYGLVYNHGDGASEATTLNVRVQGKGTKTISVPPLDPNRYYDVYSANWVWVFGRNWLDFHFEVDPGDNITERNENNNRRDGELIIYRCTISELIDGTCAYHFLNMDTMYGCSGNGISISRHPYYNVIGVDE